MAEVVPLSHKNLSAEFTALLTDYNPFETLYNVLSASMTKSTLIPDDIEMDSFLRIIVSFVGYTESTIESGQYQESIACSTPDIEGMIAFPF